MKCDNIMENEKYQQIIIFLLISLHILYMPAFSLSSFSLSFFFFLLSRCGLIYSVVYVCLVYSIVYVYIFFIVLSIVHDGDNSSMMMVSSSSFLLVSMMCSIGLFYIWSNIDVELVLYLYVYVFTFFFCILPCYL